MRQIEFHDSQIKFQSDLGTSLFVDKSPLSEDDSILQNEISKANDEGLVIVSGDNPESFFGKLLGNTRKRLILPAAVAVSLVVACGGGSDAANTSFNNPTSTSVESTSTPASGSVVAPEPSPTERIVESTSTPASGSVVAPEPSPIRERIQDVPCQLIPEDFCDKSELVEYTSLEGEKYMMIGLNLPEGTPLFAGLQGYVNITDLPLSNMGMEGKSLIITAEEDGKWKSIFIHGNVEIKDSSPQFFVTKGDQMGTVGAGGESSIDGYNVLIDLRVEDSTKTKMISDTENIDKLFPGILDFSPEKKVKQTSPNSISIE